MSWRIRKSDETIYGPVETEELVRWAQEGRIIPDDVVSRNGGPWEPAPDVPVLEMIWIVHQPERPALGPINALALSELVQSQVLPPRTRVVNRLNGESRTIEDLLLSLLLRERADRADASDPPELLEARKRLEDMAHHVEHLRHSAQTAEATHLQTQSELRQQVESLTGELQRLREESGQEREKLQQSLSEMTECATAAEAEVQKARQAEQAARAELEQTETTSRAQSETARQRNEELTQELQAIRSKVQEAEATHKDELQHLRDMFERDRAALRDDADRVSEERDHARRELAERDQQLARIEEERIEERERERELLQRVEQDTATRDALEKARLLEEELVARIENLREELDQAHAERTAAASALESLREDFARQIAMERKRADSSGASQTAQPPSHDSFYSIQHRREAGASSVAPVEQDTSWEDDDEPAYAPPADMPPPRGVPWGWMAFYILLIGGALSALFALNSTDPASQTHLRLTVVATITAVGLIAILARANRWIQR